MHRRHVAALVVATVFTLGSAAAAIALNLGTAATAGQLPGRQPTVNSSAPPSTLYVDVTVPDLPAGSQPVVDPQTPSASSAAGTHQPDADDNGHHAGHDDDD